MGGREPGDTAMGRPMLSVRGNERQAAELALKIERGAQFGAQGVNRTM